MLQEGPDFANASSRYERLLALLGVLTRLGDTSKRIDKPNLDLSARSACALGLALYAVHGAYAVATHRALYGDAAWFLVRIMTEGAVTSFYSDFSREFYYSRFVAFATTQLPTVAAVHAGWVDARKLSWILGASYFVHKPLSVWLCYRLLPTGRKSYVLFPLLGLFAGTINSEIYIVTETHLVTSFVWPLLLATTQLRQPSRLAFIAMTTGLLLGTFVYESMAFIGPLLMMVSLIRIGQTSGPQRGGWLAFSACGVLPIMINWVAILFPRDVTNASAFTGGIIQLIHDTLSGLSSAHALCVTSILSLLAVVALMGLAWRSPVESPVPRWAQIAALALAVLPASHFIAYAKSVDFTHSITDRGFGGFLMQMAIIGLYLLSILVPARVFQTAVSGGMAVASGLAIGQVSWQLLATHAWHAATQQMEEVLTSQSGLEVCTPRMRSVAANMVPAPDKILCHWWVLPLSVVLAPSSGVQTLLVSQEDYLPFDPHISMALPQAHDRHIDYGPYVRALDQAKLPASVAFTDVGNAWPYFRAGFSTPEPWATWTDGKMAKLQLCFAAGATDPRLAFKLTPKVTSVRPRLGVSVDMNGTKIADWIFLLNDTLVDRQVIVPRRRLDQNGCGTLAFTFDDERRAMEIGVPGDPRRLGLAFLSMETAY